MSKDEIYEDLTEPQPEDHELERALTTHWKDSQRDQGRHR